MLGKSGWSLEEIRRPAGGDVSRSAVEVVGGDDQAAGVDLDPQQAVVEDVSAAGGGSVRDRPARRRRRARGAARRDARRGRAARALKTS